MNERIIHTLSEISAFLGYTTNEFDDEAGCFILGKDKKTPIHFHYKDGNGEEALFVSVDTAELTDLEKIILEGVCARNNVTMIEGKWEKGFSEEHQVNCRVFREQWTTRYSHTNL